MYTKQHYQNKAINQQQKPIQTHKRKTKQTNKHHN